MRIEGWIERHAREHPRKTAVKDKDGSHTYAELWGDIVAEGERERALPLPFVLVRATPTYGFLVRYLAAHKADKVAVPLGKDTPEAQETTLADQLRGVAFPPDTSDLLFTSGTMGHRKGVLLSHKAMETNAVNLVEAQAYSPDLTFLVTGPLHHFGSLSKLFPSFMAGATVCLLDGLSDMDAFLRTIEEAETKVATFQVPSALRMLMALGEGRLREVAHKVDFIETGAAPIAEGEMLRLRSLLPSSRLFNTYASTEAGIVSTHDFASGSPLLGCLGRPLRGQHVEITPEGHIACWGDALMTGYLLRGELSIAEGKFVTGDLGWLDEEGRVRLRGRADGVMNVGGFKVMPEEVERAARALRGVSDCVCLPRQHPVLGQAPELLVVLSVDAASGQANTPLSPDATPLSPKQIAGELRRVLPPYMVPQSIRVVEAIERNEAGKIDRARYSPLPPLPTTPHTQNT